MSKRFDAPLGFEFRRRLKHRVCRNLSRFHARQMSEEVEPRPPQRRAVRSGTVRNRPIAGVKAQSRLSILSRPQVRVPNVRFTALSAGSGAVEADLTKRGMTWTLPMYRACS